MSRDPAIVFNSSIWCFTEVLRFKRYANLVGRTTVVDFFKERTNSLHIGGKTLRPYAL